MVGGQQRLAVGADIGGREGAIVDVRDHVLLGLAHREGQVAGALHPDLLVQVVHDRLVGDDEPQCVGDMGVAGGRTLLRRIVSDRGALRLDRSKAEAEHLLVFLVRLVRIVHIDEVGIFDRMLVVVDAPAGV